PPINLLVVVLDLQHLAVAHHIVEHALGPDDNPNGVAAGGQRQGEDQARPPLVVRHREAHPRLLTVQPVDPLGVGLQNLPNPVQRSCQIRANRQAHRQGAVGAVAVAQGVPREAQAAEALHVGPRLEGEHRGGGRRVGGADGGDAPPAARGTHPLPLAARGPPTGGAGAARGGRVGGGWGGGRVGLAATGPRLPKRMGATPASGRVPAGNVARTTASLASRSPNRTQPVSSSPRAAARWSAYSSKRVRPTPSVT